MLIEKKNKEIANELEKKKQAIKHQENLVIIKPHIKTNKKIGTGLKQFDKILIGGLDFNSLHLFAGNSSATSFAFLVGLAYNLWDNGYSINFITHSKKVSDIKNHLFSYAAKIDFNELDNLDNISSNYSEKLTLLSESILNSNLQITSLDIPIIPYLEKLTYTDQQQIFLIDCIQEIRFMEKSLVPPLTRDEEFAESLKRMTGIINQKKITIIASSLTNRLRDNYQSYSRKEEIGRKPMLKDLRDSNYLEHYSKTISYIDHSWNPDGVDRKDPQLVLLKNGYTQTTSEAIPLSFDHKTGYYNEPEFYNSDFKHFL